MKKQHHFWQNFAKVMAIEEMSELTKELCKELRDWANIANIADEVADVENTLAQIKMTEKIICWNWFVIG